MVAALNRRLFVTTIGYYQALLYPIQALSVTTTTSTTIVDHTILYSDTEVESILAAISTTPQLLMALPISTR